MTFPLTTTAVRLRASTRADRNGDPVEDWGSAAELAYRDVIAYPSSTVETVRAGTDVVLDGFTVHLPYGDDTTARDRFRIGDDTTVWVVDGTPEAWPIHEPGWDYGTVVHLRRLT